jgi:hypothetical protein
MAVYYSVDEIVESPEQVDIATASYAELDDEYSWLAIDIDEIEMLVGDLRERLAALSARQDIVCDRLNEIADEEVLIPIKSAA